MDYQIGGFADNNQPKKQIQILELLNEICEDSSQTVINQVNQSSLNETLIDDIKALPELEEEEEPLSATEIEEDKIITRIMQVLQQRETSESDQYQSLTYTDGIYL